MNLLNYQVVIKMALSNWDTFAMNEKSKSCEAIFKSPRGVVVKAYKNWLHIEDGTSHQNNNNISTSVIMTMYSGEITFRDTNIICSFQEDENDEDMNRTLFCIWNPDYETKITKGICGICQFGDINHESIDCLQKFLASTDYINFGIPNEFINLDLSKGRKYNQGDMFFHKELDTELHCEEIQ